MRGETAFNLSRISITTIYRKVPLQTLLSLPPFPASPVSLCFTDTMLIAYLLLAHIQAAFAFAHLSSPPASTCSDPHLTLLELSADEVRERVLSGRVYVHDDFLTDTQLRLLQRGELADCIYS